MMRIDTIYVSKEKFGCLIKISYIYWRVSFNNLKNVIMYTLILLTVLIIIRAIEMKVFINKTLNACHLYDCNFASKRFEDNNDDTYIIKMLDTSYTKKSDWSAFNFVMFKGPTLISMFFSFKPLTIKRQYDKRVVEKLNEYATA